jgi:undecaprenyl-phosphate 4-deoxy-4-formamido-L-arabinose transferase
MEDFCLRDNTPYYSIVIPVYNSQNSLEELLQRIAKALVNYKYEVITVDDNSKDASLQVLFSLKEKFKLHIVHNERNLGQAMATWIGINDSKGSFVITMDDDLEYDPSDIQLLINKQKETDADIVYGMPAENKKTLLRKIGSYLLQKFSPLSAGSSFRIIRKQSIQSFRVRQAKAILDIDLQQYCSRIERVSVAQKRRVYGKSNYTLGALIRLFLFSAIHLISFKKSNANCSR